MLAWIAANAGTIVVSFLLLAIVTAISLSLIHNKKQGKSSCGGNCSACGGCAHCRAGCK